MSLKKNKEDSAEKARKMKNLVIKLKKEIEEHKKQKSEKEEKEKELHETIEKSSQNVEQFKLEIANLMTDKEKLNNEVWLIILFLHLGKF